MALVSPVVDLIWSVQAGRSIRNELWPLIFLIVCWYCLFVVCFLIRKGKHNEETVITQAHR